MLRANGVNIVSHIVCHVSPITFISFYLLYYTPCWELIALATSLKIGIHHAR
jgi:hypothetical protein